jgi:hypothetical protein
MEFHCNWCGTVLEKGDSYLEHQGLGFCCIECATEYIMSDVELLEKVVGEDDRL